MNSITFDHELGHLAPSPEQPLRVLILLGGLGVGGAETQAINLAAELQAMGHTVELVTLADGVLRAFAEAHRLRLQVLRRFNGLSVTALPDFMQRLRRSRPQVVYAFMEIQWLLALTAVALLPRSLRPRVVLGLRTTDYDIRPSAPKERIVRALVQRSAARADLLIANSRRGLDSFRRSIPNSPTGVVVPNGIDVSRFAPSTSSRAYWRRMWSIPAEATVVGHVGRFDPVKGHELLLQAFALECGADPSCHLVCIGNCEPNRLAELEQLVRSLGIEGRVHFFPAQLDTSSLYPAFDVLALTSFREGFPNVVAEAMSCGVPAVVTDCGASGEIASSLGEVVAVGSIDAFADGLSRLLNRRSATLAHACRSHVHSSFDIHVAAARTAAALQSLCSATSK